MISWNEEGYKSAGIGDDGVVICFSHKARRQFARKDLSDQKASAFPLLSQAAATRRQCCPKHLLHEILEKVAMENSKSELSEGKKNEGKMNLLKFGPYI